MAPSHSQDTRRSPLGRAAEFVLPLAIVGCIMVLLCPMPAAMLDILLAANITLAVVILLTGLQVRSPLEFSSFPTLLLVTTLARLVLNVASTRLILSGADVAGLEAAGGVIRSFSEFVAGDRLLVGAIIFGILVLVQFVVITKGAGRIGEVAARFALDGLPGRQMAIDADLTAGSIDQTEAHRRREELTRQADFYASMDGASKFVRGDAIAGLVITAINILGGLAIGVLQSGMNITEAAELFTRLTIGDGLVSQVPALLISLAAGVLVTRTSAPTNLSGDVVRQTLTSPQTLVLTAGFLVLLVGTNLPKVPLLVLAAGCGVLWMVASARVRRREEQSRKTTPTKTRTKPQETSPVEDLLRVDPLEVELGVGLIRLAERGRGGDLIGRISEVRHSVAAELGIVLPKVRVHDNIRLERNQYRIKLSGLPIASGEVHPSRLVALDWGTAHGHLDGLAMTDPAFGLPGVWIDPQRREAAEASGYQVTDSAGIIATHLTEIIRRHASELLTREATAELIEGLRRRSPTLVSEVVPKLVSVGQVQCVLQLLLEEGVPVRNLSLVVEALGDATAKDETVAHDTEYLAEAARKRLARALCHRYRDEEGRLWVVSLDSEWERLLTDSLANSELGEPGQVSENIEEVCRQIDRECERLTAAGHPKVVLVSSRLRRALRQQTASRLPDVVLLGRREVTSDTRVEVVARVGLRRPAAA